MQVQIRNGYDKEDLKFTPDLRVIVDVFRASTTTAAILEKTPEDFLITNDLLVIEDLIKRSYRLVSEVIDLGIDNSPSLIRKMMKDGEKVVLKTSNLTTAIEANYFDGRVVIACFNNLRALVKWIENKKFQRIEIIPAGLMQHKQPTPEDTYCAELMLDVLLGKKARLPSLDFILGNWEELKRTRNWPIHYIDDLEIAVQLDISDKIPCVVRQATGLFSVEILT